MKSAFCQHWATAASVCLLLAWGAGNALARDLPASTLTLWTEGNQLNLRISLPVEGLVAASASLGPLNDAEAAQELALLERVLLARYLARHISLSQGRTRLSLTFEDAVLRESQSEDVGSLVMVDAEMTASLPRHGKLFPLTLSYDAVMHAVRDHRAAVFWQPPGTLATHMAEYGYRTFDDKPRPVILQRPRR